MQQTERGKRNMRFFRFFMCGYRRIVFKFFVKQCLTNRHACALRFAATQFSRFDRSILTHALGN